MLFLFGFLGWLFCFHSSRGRSDVRYGIRGCGGGSKETTIVQPAAAPTAGETAESIYQAQLKYNPLAAQQSYDILTSPEYGLTPTTQAYEQTRQQLYPEETNVRNQLVQNVLANLISPTGISPEQQAAQDAIRGRAQTDLTRSVRESANLGGGLYGGRRELREDRGLTEMLQGFAESDIAREERNRLNALQAAIPVLQALYPNVQLTPPTFESPVPSANAAYQGGISQYSTNAQLAAAQAQVNAQQNAANSQMWGSLWGGLGQGIGSLGGGWLAGRK